MARERYSTERGTSMIEETKIDEDGVTISRGIPVRFILCMFFMVIILVGMPWLGNRLFPLPKDHVIELCIEEYGWGIKRLGRDVSFSPMSADWHEIVSSIQFIELYIHYDIPQLYHTVTYGYCFVAGGADFYYFRQHLRGVD